MMGSAAAYMARQPEVHSVTTGPTARPAARARWLLASTTSTEIRRYAPQPSTLPTRRLPVVRQELGLASKRKRPELRSRPPADSRPAWPPILGRDLVRRLDGRADAPKLDVGAHAGETHAAFSLPARFFRRRTHQRVGGTRRILRRGKLTTIEPFTAPEEFH